MRFTSQHKAINQKEYGKAVSPLRYDSLALILSWSIFVVYGKQSEKKSIFAIQRGILPYTLFGILPLPDLSDLSGSSAGSLFGYKKGCSLPR